MRLTIEDVEYIADLARLQLTEEEKKLFQIQLTEILQYASSLQKVETANILPTARVSLSEITLRLDEPRSGLTPEQLIANAPKTKDTQFCVPRVFE